MAEKIDPEDHVFLFEDYAAITRDAVPRTYVLGNVTRVLHKSTDFKEPVLFNEPRAKDIKVYMQTYSSSGLDPLEFKMDTNITCFSLGDILSHVNLSYDSNHDVYHLDSAEQEVLEAGLQTILAPKRRKQTRQAKTTQMSEDSGRRTLVLPPAPSTSGTRRSSRTRTVVLHECS